jgi:hypothetical protein
MVYFSAAKINGGRVRIRARARSSMANAELACAEISGSNARRWQMTVALAGHPTARGGDDDIAVSAPSLGLSG